MKTKMERGILLLEAMLASLVTMVPMGSAQTEVSGLTEIELWHVLLAISIFFAILTFSYPLVMRIRRKRREEREEERIEEKEMRREEEVMKILREIEDLKEKIERRGMKLTSISDVFLVSVQILSEISKGSRIQDGMIKRQNRGIGEGNKERNGRCEGSNPVWYCNNFGYKPYNNINTVMNISHSSYHKQVGAHSGI